MDIRTDEVAAGIFRVSVLLPQAQGGAGFMFNHFLIVGDEPMLFHCGLRKMFPLVSEAVGRIIPIQKLRWLGFGHFEADECGSMNEWLAASPHAQVTHGAVGCRVSISDMADRPPRVLADGEIVDCVVWVAYFCAHRSPPSSRLMFSNFHHGRSVEAAPMVSPCQKPRLP